MWRRRCRWTVRLHRVDEHTAIGGPSEMSPQLRADRECEGAVLARDAIGERDQDRDDRTLPGTCDAPLVAMKDLSWLLARDADRSAWPRPLAMIAGLWLVLTAFVWPHSSAVFANDVIVGGAIIVVGLVSLRFHVFRFAHLALAVWLGISVFVLPHSTPLTVGHDLIIALFVAADSLVPGLVHDPDYGQRGNAATIA